MKFDDESESRNVEDRRGGGGGRGPVGRGSIGVGTIVLALAAWYFGIDPSIVLNGSQMLQNAPTSQSSQGPATDASPSETAARQLVGRVLKSTESTWHEIFSAHKAQYVEPKLVMFRGQTSTACGRGESAMGPFYCPADQKVYIDLGFFDEMKNRFQAPGDFAQAYVVAHEVGHHVQNLMGLSGKVHEAKQGLSQAKANALSVKLELQADCFAGLWAHHAQIQLEPGDIEEALNAATAIGDDTLQRQSRGTVVPESFTHGSSAQRVRWFQTGMQQGQLAACDTFKARDL